MMLTMLANGVHYVVCTLETLEDIVYNEVFLFERRQSFVCTINPSALYNQNTADDKGKKFFSSSKMLISHRRFISSV